MIALDAS